MEHKKIIREKIEVKLKAKIESDKGNHQKTDNLQATGSTHLSCKKLK